MPMTSKRYSVKASSPCLSYAIGKRVLLPGPVEERGDPVVEDVEEGPKGGVLVGDPLANELRVGIREDPLRSGQPDEVDRHLGRPVLLPRGRRLQVDDLAGREGERRVGTEADDFVPGPHRPADPFLSGRRPLQKPHRLEEGERYGSE